MSLDVFSFSFFSRLCTPQSSGQQNFFKMCDDKFDCRNDVFIAATTEINYLDLRNYLMRKMYRNGNSFPKGTKFYLISGIHHYEIKKPEKEIVLGHADSKLTSQFHDTVFSDLKNFCGFMACESCHRAGRIKECDSIKKCKSDFGPKYSSIWSDMEYKVQPVLIYTEKPPGKKEYTLKELSRDQLTKNLMEDLHNSSRPSVLIFASCFSSLSSITNILTYFGILATLKISNEIGRNFEGTAYEGKAYSLDEIQKDIIDAMDPEKVP